MKKLIVLFLVCCTTMQIACAGIELFNTDPGNWQYGYGLGVDHNVWNSTNGNPGGYLSGSLNNLHKVWTTETTTFGDITGATMTVDTKIDASGEIYGKAQFYIGAENSYYISEAWNITPDKKWTTHRFNVSDFTPWDNASVLSLESVASSASEMGIFFGTKLAQGEGTFMIDNFGITPEPATLIFLGVGGMLSYLIR